MKYMIYLLAAIYIIGAFVIFKFFFAGEENKKINIAEIKKSIVVIVPEKNIISYKNNPKGIFKEYKNSGIGTGFFINNDGTIQTVSHILGKNNTVIYKGNKYSSEILKNDTINDLAILKININNNSYLNYGKINNNSYLNYGKINNNEKIISFGINPINLNIIYNTGVLLNKKSKLENMSNLLEISNILKPGFSGGPIINSKGKVIGINYAISEGKNYGISF